MKNRKGLLRRALCLLMVAVMLLPVFANFDFTVEVHAATQNQMNMVARADYMYNITWVCKKTVSGWKSNYTYYEGNTYRIPYAWPVTAGKWVPYGISVEDFLKATTDPNSDFYTKQSYYSGNTGSYSTYYGNDCSTFVSFCWGLSTRQTTSSLPNVSTLIGNVTTSNVNSKLQLGDALDYSGSHVVLVTDIVYNSAGAITSIEITEQTPPQIKRSTYTVSSLVSKYGAKYKIYRYTGNVAAAPNAPATPSISINPNDYTVPTTDISYTAGGTMPSGSTVYWVQAVLYHLGYDIDVDGKYGSGSSGTVSQFQKDFGLTSNGVVNAETRAMLIKCWTNNRGYYTVTTASSPLTIRSGAGTSYGKVASAAKGSQIPVIGFNADRSWGNAIVDGVVGWGSAQYLGFNRFFNYTISYNPNNSTATGTMPSANQKAYSQYTVLGSDVTASGATLKGWWLYRTSDQSWYVDGTGWVSDANIASYTRKIFAPGAKFSLDESILNMATGDDGYILYGVWENKDISLGVYKVTAGNLNMRADSNASAAIVTVLANGNEVQVIGYNEAKTWVNIIFGQYKGWVNVNYLEYARAFQYTVKYSADLAGAANPASVVLAKNGTTSVAGATAEGYTLDGWYVQRGSDGAWWNGSGWTASEASKALVAAGTSFGATTANINTAAGDDTFVFHGVWKATNIPLGVYSVTAFNLNMRAESNASASVVTVLENGNEVQVIGYNEAKTWVNIIFGQYKGWVNVKYLEYVRDFQYTVKYSADLAGAANPASVVLAKNGTTSVAGATAEGYTLDGWYVQRGSDGAWWNGSGWTADEASKALMIPGTSFGAIDANLNGAVGDDTFTFHGEWTSTVREGDINGDGNVNSRDTMALRKHLAAVNTLEGEALERADIDGNGRVNSKDSLALRRIIGVK